MTQIIGNKGYPHETLITNLQMNKHSTRNVFSIVAFLVARAIEFINCGGQSDTK